MTAELVLCFDKFELDCGAMLLRYAGQLVPAEPTSVCVLAALLRNQGLLLSRAELIKQVWRDRPPSDNALSVAMTRLRRLLCDYGLPRDCVTTVYSRGYCFSGKIPVRLVTSRSRASRLDRAPFVGREGVLAELARALAAASRGFGSLVALHGAPGIGKTCTAEAFAKEALRVGCVVHWIPRAAGVGDPSWWLPNELQRCLNVGDLRAHPSQSRLGSLVPTVGMSHARLTYQLDPHLRYDLFEQLERAMTHRPDGAPAVFVIDAIHLGDAASLDFVRYLLARIGRTRLLVVATLDELPRGNLSDPALLSVFTHPNCVRLGLGPLSAAEVERYVRQACGHHRGLHERVYELSGGNPLYLAELVEQAKQGSMVDPDRLTPPASASRLARQQLTALDAETLSVLESASVIGAQFCLPRLAAAAGCKPAALMAALDRAREAALVRCVGQSTTHFAFTQSMLRLVLYEGLSPERRRASQQRLNEARG